MQTVWTRVAQTRTACRCARCEIKSRLTRHSATATPGKRPTRYFTSSTLLYSGIFAAAATADAQVKDRRRAQWDRAIEDVKRGLEDVGSPQSRTVAEADLGSKDYFDENWEGLRDLEAVGEGKMWPQNFGAPFEQYNWSPQSIYAVSGLRQKYQTWTWTPKKLRLMSLQMDKLTLRTLIWLHERGVLQDASWDSSEGKHGRAFAQLVGLSRRDLVHLHRVLEERVVLAKAIDSNEDTSAFSECAGILTDYRHHADSDGVTTARALHTDVSKMLDAHRKADSTPAQTLLRVLFELTQSLAPPKLSTFNLLLQAFNKNDYAETTLNIFRAMRSSHIRLNETSLHEMIKYYIRADDYSGFCHLLDLMNGNAGGLCLARPDILITPASQGRLHRVQRFGKERIIQTPSANPIVFDAVVLGAVHFDGLQTALRACELKGRHGWGVSVKGLQALLMECARVRNWKLGYSVWEQMLRLRNRADPQSSEAKLNRWTYAGMLQLCAACGKQSEFQGFLLEATGPGLEYDRAGLLRDVQRVQRMCELATERREQRELEKARQASRESEIDTEARAEDKAAASAPAEESSDVIKWFDDNNATDEDHANEDGDADFDDALSGLEAQEAGNARPSMKISWRRQPIRNMFSDHFGARMSQSTLR